MEYTTDFTDKDLLNSDGCQAEYCFDIERKRGVGVITVENGEIYLCQNDFDGIPCQDKKGFRYSYILDLNDPSNGGYYKEIIQKLYKPKSLVGRYLKALVDNAQSSKVIKNNFYKIVFENPDSIEFYTEFFPEMTLRLDKENEGVFFELMPEGFEPNQNPTVLGVELVKGEYYVMETGSQWIAKFDRIEDNIFYNKYSISLTTNSYYFGGGGLCELKFIKSISKANFSERLWLDKCIAAGKFIPKEEALKEKGFELPEKWCCVLTEQNASVLIKWADISSRLSINGRTYITYQKLWGYSNKDSYIEITFEQFKKYVLKEDTFIDTFNPLAEPSTDKPTHEYEKLRSYIKDEAMKSLGMTTLLSNNPGTTVSNLTLNYHNHAIIDLQKTKSDLEFQEPVIIKSIKNKPKLIIINN